MATRSEPKAFVGAIPSDLVLVAVLALWTLAVAGGASTGAQAVLGIVAVLFAPGYALVAALFPGQRSSTVLFATGAFGPDTDRGTVTLIERLVLSVGLSVCVVPLVGLGLDYTPWGVQPASLLSGIGATTLVLTVVAAVRRGRTPLDERFDPRLVASTRRLGHRIGVATGNSPVTVLLIVGLVIAGSGIGVAVMNADHGEEFTEFYLVTERADGEFVAGDYPDEIALNDAENVTVGIGNEEGERMEYTVVVLLQSLDAGGEPRDIQRVDTFTVTVPKGETVTESRAIRPETTGDNLRVTYLLYRGSPPEVNSPSVDNAYRHAHFWIEVPVT